MLGVKSCRQLFHFCIIQAKVFRLDQVGELRRARRRSFGARKFFDDCQQFKRGAVGRNVACLKPQLEIAGQRLFAHDPRNCLGVCRTLPHHQGNV